MSKNFKKWAQNYVYYLNAANQNFILIKNYLLSIWNAWSSCYRKCWVWKHPKCKWYLCRRMREVWWCKITNFFFIAPQIKIIKVPTFFYHTPPFHKSCLRLWMQRQLCNSIIIQFKIIHINFFVYTYKR